MSYCAHMKREKAHGWTWVVIATLSLPLFIRVSALAESPAKDDASQFFGLTSIWTLHLSVTPEDWARMQPPTQEFGPGRQGWRPGDGPPMMRRWDQRGTNRMMMPFRHIEFTSVPATLDFEGKAFGKIGLRFKGNSSFRGSSRSVKRPFKLDFNDYVKGQKFFGLTKLSLNNNIHDSSQMREALAYRIFRDAGVAAPRTAYVRLYLTVPDQYDKEYLGLYTAVEPIEGPFLQDRFGSKKGLLLKPNIPKEISYLGERSQIYSNRYGAKTAADEAQWKSFIRFAAIVDHGNDTLFRSKISSYLDVDQFLKFLAVETATANLDSPLSMGHNYYLYLNPKTDKLVWIPWDLNEAFGDFRMAGPADQQVDLSVDHPYAGENKLIQRLLAIPAYQKSYHEALASLAELFRRDQIQSEIDTLAKVLRPVVAEDPEVVLDRFDRAIFGAEVGSQESGGRNQQAEGKGQGNLDFPNRGFGRGMRPQESPPLKKFIAERGESILEQLQGKRQGQIPETRRPPFARGGMQPGNRPFPQDRPAPRFD